MTKERIQYINLSVLLLTAFIIPLYQPAIRFSIIALVIVTLFNLTAPKWRIHYSFLLGYYIILALGLLWTSNLERGLHELEYNLSFIVFPLIMIFANLNWKQVIFKVLSFFSIGYFVGIIICIVAAVVSYIQERDLGAFYYADLSILHHPTYMAMYGSLSIIYLYASIANESVVTYYFKSNRTKFSLIGLFSIFIILLMSKAGITAMLLINISGIFVLFHKKQQLYKAFLIALGLLLVAGGSYLSISPLKNRIDEVWHSFSSEEVSESSTGARVLTWESSLELIKSHPLQGVGTGDVHDQLQKVYEANHYQKLTQKSLNAHNQFLETTAKNGLIGIISLLLSFAAILYKSEHKLYLWFVVLVFFNFLMESMLQVQSGIVFTAFFNTIFSLSILQVKTNE